MFRRPFYIGRLFLLLLTRVHQRSQDGRAPVRRRRRTGEMEIGICTQCIINILIPIKLNTKAKPYLRKIKRSAKSASKKYMARRPKMAKMLEVRTMKGSVVTAKIAGMLSTAKMTSLNSIIINTSKSGVAMRLPFHGKEFFTVKLLAGRDDFFE